MGQVTDNFLAGLSERGDEPPVRKITGTIRIDLRHDGGIDHWNLTFDRGQVSVEREAQGRQGADLHMITDSEVFDSLASGQAHASAAVLRGAILVTGDQEKLVAFQRLFPGPPRKATRGRRP